MLRKCKAIHFRFKLVSRAAVFSLVFIQIALCEIAWASQSKCDKALTSNALVSENKFLSDKEFKTFKTRVALKRMMTAELFEEKEFQQLKNAQLFKVAKIFVASQFQSSKYIANFVGLTNVQLFEIAKIAAKIQSDSTSKYITNYVGLTNTQLFEVAKIAAASQANSSEYIANYVGLTNTQLFQIAKTAANAPNDTISKYIANYVGLTNAQLFQIAKKAAKAEDNQTSMYIANYVGLTSAQLFQIAKIDAASPHGNSQYISNYVGLTNTQLFEVAKIAAASQYDNSRYIVNYAGLTNAQLFEIAKIAAKYSSKYIANYVGLTNDQLFEVAKLAATSNPAETSIHIKNYAGLTNEQIFEVAKIAATSFWYGFSPNIANYVNLTNVQLFELAKLAALSHGDQTSQFIKNYVGLTNLQLFEIAKICLKSRGKLDTVTHLLVDFDLTPLQQVAIVKLAFRIGINKSKLASHVRTILYHDKAAKNQPQLRDTLLNLIYRLDPFVANEPSLLEIAEVKNDYSIKFDEKVTKTEPLKQNLLRKEFDKLLALAWDRVQDREVGIRLMDEGQILIARRRILPADSIDLVSFISGLNLRELNLKKTSSNSLKKIYELLLDIQINLYGPFFKSVSISPEIIKNPKSLIELLTLVRDLKSIRGNQLEGAKFVLEILKPSISQENFSHIMSRLQKEIVSAVLALFKAGTSLQTQDANHKDLFTYETLKRLQEHWGNLEPIFTLSSRYKGNPEWQILLPNLKKVFLASLDRTFSQLKFQGDIADPSDQAAAKKQLSMLTKTQIEKWQEPRVLVEPFDQHTFGSPIDNTEQIKNLILDNLLVHSPSLNEINSAAQLQFSTIAQMILTSKSAPQEILNEILRTFESTTNDFVFLAGLHFLESQARDGKNLNLSDIKKMISYIEFLILKDASLVRAISLNDVNQDIKSIKELLNNEIKGSQSNKFLVMTILNSDPKFLLTIGDRVNTSSCQNYRTGSVIQTLLGYVLDAQVQAMVSFAVEPQHFENAEDFEAVYEALNDPQMKARTKTNFDGNLVVAHFTLPSGRIISTKTLGYGYLRQIVKVGEIEATHEPAIFFEREYIQTHRATPQMRQQFKTLAQDLAKDLNATTSGKIKIAGSRNKLGHYSDAGGGKVKEAYYVEKM